MSIDDNQHWVVIIKSADCYDYFEEFTNPLSTCAHDGQIHYLLAHNAQDSVLADSEHE